jgi:hypothetical protein
VRGGGDREDDEVVTWTQDPLFPLWNPGDLVHYRRERRRWETGDQTPHVLGRVLSVVGGSVEVEWEARAGSSFPTFVGSAQLKAAPW